MKWALINAYGQIVNIISYNGDEYAPPEGLTLVQIEDHVEIGDTY